MSGYTSSRRRSAQSPVAAAAMVGDGESVALDSSTTAYYLALELRRKREIVVVTNGLLNAVALADSPGVNVLVTGGMFRLPAMSVVGDPAGDVLRGTRIDKGFLGVRGISVDRGLMDLNPEEVQIKREMAAACERVIAIFDKTKWHRSALLSFVPSGRVDAIVTDSGAPAELVQAWRERGVDVTTAEPDAAARHPERLPGLRPRTDGESSEQRRPPASERVTWRPWPPSIWARRAVGSRSGASTATGSRSSRCTASRTSLCERAARSTGTCSGCTRRSSRD